MTLLAFILAAAPGPEVLDVSKQLADMQLYSDGKGHYVAVFRPEHNVYYGDGKTMYLTNPWAWGERKGQFEASIRDERYNAMEQTQVNSSATGITVVCGKRPTEMTPAQGGADLLAKASFQRSPHDHLPYRLARDDSGNYYYVEHGRYRDNERSFRVHVGPRGKMKQLGLKNVVHDTEGDIFSTASGDLRLVAGSSGMAEWVKNNKRTQLVDVPVDTNVGLIYNELGVYTRLRLGQPCDDL